MGVGLTVLVICKTPRQNLRVYLGFSVCSLGFLFHFVLVPFLHLQTDVKLRKRTKIPVCSFPKVGHSQGKEKVSTWFLKSPKAASQNSAQLVDAKAKRRPFNG